MGSNLDLDITFDQDQPFHHQNDEETNPKHNSSKVFRALNRIMTIMNNSIFIELIVVLIVVVGAILSSELGIHIGQSRM